jgi:tRNA dimethylallyltransferase
MARKTSLVIITGPTCSGKTKLALALGKQYPIEVISADSMQVYKYMDIATAKPTLKEQDIVPHHLIDVIEPDKEFNAGMFAEMAQQKIEEIRSRKKIPIVVGGTGLYIKALIYGLCPAPPRSEQLRSTFKKIIEEKGISYMHHMLEKLDPDAAAGITQKDRTRIVRALEIIFLTGKKPSSIQKSHGFESPQINAKIFCLLPERSLLYSRIDKRVNEMIEAGLIEETKRLLDMGYNSELRSMQTLAYKHVVDHLTSSLSIEETIRLIQRDTRRYAKRQITWIKAQENIKFFDDIENAKLAIEKCL